MKIRNYRLVTYCLIVIGLLAALVIGLKKKKSQKLNIGIIQISEHESLDKARNGFIDGLKELGYDANFDIQIAGGDLSNLSSISSKFVNDKKDLILAISTPAAQNIASATKDIPILATAVTDFKSSGLVSSLNSPEQNISGTSDLVPVEKQIGLLKSIVPNCKKVGILYSSNESNSKIQADIAKKECEKLGMESQDYTISSSNEIHQVVGQMSVDAMFVPTDNLVVASMPAVSTIANERHIPIICSEAGSVSNGAVASYAMDYYELGKMTARQADKILKGTKIKDIPVEYLENSQLTLNNEVIKKLNLKIPKK